MYPEVVESQQGKSVVALYPTPGLSVFIDGAALGPTRGAYRASSGRLFVVRGTQLAEIFGDGVEDELGTLTSGFGPVSMTDNGLALLVVDGSTGYTYTYSSGTFAQIVDADFLGATHVGYVDGYFVALRPQSAIFAWSGLFASTWDGLDFATAEGAPDLAVALIVWHREVYILGLSTVEIFHTTGQASADAFARAGGLVIEYGCLAPWSPAIVGDHLCWLGSTQRGGPTVVQLQGTQLTTISTSPMEAELKTYSTLNDAMGWGEADEKHQFYWLSFPNQGVTWVYDFASGLWHKRQYGQQGAHLASAHVYAHGRHLVGSRLDGTLYALDSTVYDDDGVEIVRELTLPPVYDADNNVCLTHRAFELYCETGVGLDEGVVPGTTPKALVSYSNDGAHTWNSGAYVPLGAHGEYRTRARLRRLGQPRDRRYRVRFTDPCKFVVLGAGVDVEPARA